MAQPCLVARASSLSRLHDHIQAHPGTPRSVGLLYMSYQPEAGTCTWQHTTFTRDRRTCPPAGFEPTVSTGERPQTHALDCVAIGIDINIIEVEIGFYICLFYKKHSGTQEESVNAQTPPENIRSDLASK